MPLIMVTNNQQLKFNSNSIKIVRMILRKLSNFHKGSRYLNDGIPYQTLLKWINTLVGLL